MKDEPSKSTKSGSSSRSQRPTRKLSLSSRVRKSMRRGSDRVLAADMAWSAALIVVVVALLATQRCGRDYGPFVVGQVATADFKAPLDAELRDDGLTEERRRQAREDVPDAYVVDTDRGARLAGRLSAVFDDGRHALEQASLTERDSGEVASRTLADRVPPESMSTLVSHRFDAALERELSSALRRVMAGRIVGNKAALERESAVTLVELPGNRRETVEEFDEFIDLNQAREQLRRDVRDRLELPTADERALGELVASFVDPNVYFDPETTFREQNEAWDSVAPVLTRIAQGDLLVRRGERLTAATVARLDQATSAGRQPLGAREGLGMLFIAALLAFFLFRYSRYHQRAFRKMPHLHSLLVLMLVSTLMLSRAMLWIVLKVVDNLESPFNHFSSYSYLIPLGAGAILVALLANGRIATVYSSFAALLFGAINRWDPHLMMWAMLVQCAGVYAISTYRERAALLRAGMVVGGAGAVSTLALETLKGSLEPLQRSLYGAGLAFVGGAVGVGLVISFSLPLLERLFNVLTDIRLLELSNVNNPLLSELAIKAPGSYNHSLVVGTLAEEASRAIGANALFCRVAAFYHDVGKMNKAEYYVENQRGVNPHDRLSPSMSALIIASHVKDGIKMAREAGLPEQIVDIIPQHHGTKMMTYFYEKSKKNADPSMGPVKEVDFRYPGPKPQTREAAIFMMADAVEAAARTVDEPTANRLKEMIRKVTNAIVLDDQLDSCELTFADLDKIQNAFLRCLVSMYHHRVDYPGFDFGRPKGEGKGEPKGEPKSDTQGESRPAPQPAGEVRERKTARSN